MIGCCACWNPASFVDFEPTNHIKTPPAIRPFPSDLSTATRGTLEPDAEERIDAGRFTLQALVLKGLGVP